MPVMTRPKLGDVRYLVTWIDRDAMRQTVGDDDLPDRLEAAERGKSFASESGAKIWAQANARRDEYGSPRLEQQTFEREYPDVPPDWQRGEYQEWSEGRWQPLVF